MTATVNYGSNLVLPQMKFLKLEEFMKMFPENIYDECVGFSAKDGFLYRLVEFDKEKKILYKSEQVDELCSPAGENIDSRKADPIDNYYIRESSSPCYGELHYSQKSLERFPLGVFGDIFSKYEEIVNNERKQDYLFFDAVRIYSWEEAEEKGFLKLLEKEWWQGTKDWRTDSYPEACWGYKYSISIRGIRKSRLDVKQINEILFLENCLCEFTGEEL